MTTIKSEAVARVLDEEVKMGEKNVAEEKEEEEGTEKTDALSASFIEDLKEDLEFKSEDDLATFGINSETKRKDISSYIRHNKNCVYKFKNGLAYVTKSTKSHEPFA